LDGGRDLSDEGGCPDNELALVLDPTSDLVLLVLGPTSDIELEVFGPTSDMELEVI
jgi:hypothetical protein